MRKAMPQQVHDALAATPYGRGLFAMQLMPVG